MKNISEYNQILLPLLQAKKAAKELRWFLAVEIIQIAIDGVCVIWQTGPTPILDESVGSVNDAGVPELGDGP